MNGWCSESPAFGKPRTVNANYMNVVKYIAVILVLFFTCSAFVEDPKPDFFIGEWKAWNDTVVKTNFSHLYLTKTGSSYVSQGVRRNGKDELVPFLITEIVSWTVKNDTLTLQSKPIPSDNKGNTNSMTMLYVIKEKGSNYFVAYYSDPELDQMVLEGGNKAAPRLLRFERQ